MLLCARFHQNWTTLSLRYGYLTIFEMADGRHIEFEGTNNGFLKSPCRASDGSLIETIAISCLVFEKNRIFARILTTDKQTNVQTEIINA